MEGQLVQSSKERKWPVIFSAVSSGSMTLAEASAATGLSRRQVSRVYKRYCAKLAVDMPVALARYRDG